MSNIQMYLFFNSNYTDEILFDIPTSHPNFYKYESSVIFNL